MKRKYRATWDEVATLDCDHIASWGALQGYVGPIEFDASVPAEIDTRHDPTSDALTVSYAWPGRPSRPVEDVVRINRRPCPFGGARAYFLCPRCSRRTLRLAVLACGLRCGRCGNITWASRRQTRTQRLVWKARRLADVLQLSSWIGSPVRPPGMRVARYLRLTDALETLKAELNQEIAPRLIRLRPLSLLATL